MRREHGGGEYRKEVSGHDVWVELQWRAIAGRWIRKDQEPPAEELLARAVPVAGSAVRILAPTDNMLQVCLHTAKHSYVRAPGLRLHTDVDRLVAYTPPDWDELFARAKALRVKTPVYFSLALANALLNTPIPDQVLEALAPPRWKIEALDTDPEHLGPRYLPRNLWRGLARIKDLVTRYQP